MTTAPPYTPAPYLLRHSFLTAPQLISQYQDFYISLEQNPSAPGLVFERLVAGIINDFNTTIEKERLQHDATLKEFHDENVALRLSNDQLKSELGGLKKTNNQRNININNPTIGKFHTNEVRRAEVLPEYSKTILFTTPYSAPPNLIVGFNGLDIGFQEKICANSHATNIQKDRFTIRLDSGGDGIMHGSACAWLEIAESDPDFQFGEFSTLEDHSSPEPQFYTSRIIKFPRAYTSLPQVVVWLTAFDLGRDNVFRVRTFTTDITTAGFTIHINSWSGSAVLSATSSWIAYPSDKAGIFGGTFSTLNVRSWDKHQLQNSAYVNFGSNVFTAPPRIFLVFNSLSMSQKTNLRLATRASSVTAAGMTWHIEGWADTILYSAGVSYIALV